MKGTALLVTGAIVGLVISGGTASGIIYSNKPDFCISCHEMKANVYEEYKKSTHFTNASGVQATCSDCHVDKSSWQVMILDKSKKGTYDIYQHLVGSIDTAEKYEDKKKELVERVQKRMRANDSAACRHCHNWDTVNLAAQEDRAKNGHEKMRPEETCIDCHQGVVHASNKPDPEEQGFTL